MPRFPKPPEGSWTQHYPELGTAPVSYEDSISPEIHDLEREAIFKRAWLNVGRVEQLPRKGSYFTKELKAVNTSIILVRTISGEINAFHNVCRHRGNKLVWNDMPQEETSGVCRQFTCKYHAWRYDLDGNLTFVQQEEEFFDLDKSRYGLVSVHCEVWEGFIFVNFAKEPQQSLREFLGPMITDLEGYPFGKLTSRFYYRSEVKANWKLYMDAFQEFYHAPVLAREPVADRLFEGGRGGWFRGSALPSGRPAPAGQHIGYPRLGDGGRDAQAHRGHLPERTVRALGQARFGRDARRAEPREM